MPELSPNQKRTFLLKLVTVGAVFGLLCIPICYVASPPWEVQVTDASGQPIPSAKIEQDWSYYFGAHYKEASEVFKADNMGRISLPERKVWTSGFSAWAGRAFGILNVHSSSGPSSSVHVSQTGYDRISVWRNPTLPLSNGVFYSTVTLRREQRPAAITDAVLAGDLEKLRVELQNDAYYAKEMHGVVLVNDIIRSSKVADRDGIAMVDLVLNYLGKPDTKTPNIINGIRCGIPPWIEFEDKDNLTALQRSIALQQFEVAHHLLSQGVVPNSDQSWQTPTTPSALHLAVQAGNVELIKALLNSKAKVDAKDPKGETPLDWAKKSRNQQVIQILEAGK